MSVSVIHADSRDALREMADASIDACVCDPPYSLVSIVKRFGGANAAPVKVNEFHGADGASKGASPYLRASAGFMGKTWDTGETAFDPAFWAEVLRVLKPGAHLIAFGGTRTYHRLVCAIEDAGFEVRDTVAWLYGSGFPKSHDVSKAIDRARRRDFVLAAVELGLEIPGNSLHDWTRAEHSPSDQWWDEFKRVLAPEQWLQIERRVIAKGAAGLGSGKDGAAHGGGYNADYDVTAPATDAARQWQGWGSALKPAMELICLARKPLIGTIAQNVLAHGTGALNIDVSRIEASEDIGERRNNVSLGGASGGIYGEAGAFTSKPHAAGRWPANVIHDGSEEVLRGFPESEDGVAVQRNGGGQRIGNLVYSGSKSIDARPDVGFGGGGSAARFFYTAKADADDRLGSKHPTVKPVDLMAYLVKLVTPPGGVVLDPFAGSGTTAMACMREGFRAILIEREAEYVADIKRRIAHVRGEDTPLFAEVI